MKITERWLRRRFACEEGIAWFNNQSKTLPSEVAEQLIREKQYSWAMWLFIRTMSLSQERRFDANITAAIITRGKSNATTASSLMYGVRLLAETENRWYRRLWRWLFTSGKATEKE